MKVSASNQAPFDLAADALVLIAHEDGLTGWAAEANTRLSGTLEQLIRDGEISTKIGRTWILHHPPGFQAKQLVIVGGGTSQELGAGQMIRIAGSAAKRLADRNREKVIFALNASSNLVSAAVIGAMNGGVGQDLFKTEKVFKPAGEIVIVSDHPEAVERGSIIARGMLLVRDLVNLPANMLNPSTFAARAVNVCESHGIQIEVWEEERLRAEGCESLLAVADGSANSPRLLIMRYPGTQQAPPVALVGKGVTFDSGGLSLKPTDSMLTMKCDMAGAATVLGSLQVAAELKIAQPIVGLVGLVENMISGNAFRLGDVLKARSGTTIEVHNTDAEGRLVLADVLNVAIDQNPDCIIDLATLTGACVVALGTDIAGLMTNNEPLQQRFREAAERAGEWVWPLPMYSFFDEQINGQVADIKNVGDGRWGGAITAAKFLERFVAGKPWLHIDIAGPAFADKPKAHQDAGATAAMLRSLIEFLTAR